MTLHDYERIRERLHAVANPVSFLVNLFAHAPVGFAVWAADGRALLTNKAFIDMFLTEPPPEYNVLKDDVLEANGMLAIFKRAFAGETVHLPTFWYDPRDLKIISTTEGRRIAISMTIFPLFKEGGTEIDYVAATYKDQTEIMLANERLRLSEAEERKLEALQLAKDAADAANAELEAFSYSVAHDLRAPLRAINGFSSILLADYAPKLDDEGRRYLERVIANAQRMSSITDDLLKLAQVSRSELQRETVDLSVIARGIVDVLQGHDPSRGGSLDVHVEDGLMATVDPRLTKIVLENLIGNACKFTSKEPDARVVVGKEESSEGEMIFFVRDNGVGFDMGDATAAKLFTPFHRLHRDSDFEGTGIGLATVQRIVARHGGRVWAESAANKGTTFRFTVTEKTT